MALQSCSLIDYPGRVACVFFLTGCNLACPYCHNPELARGLDDPHLVSRDEALRHLERRRGLVKGVVLSGGEPTLYDDLPALARDIHARGCLVKLDTNGTNPDRIRAVGADYVALDLKTSPARYRELWPGAPADAAERIRESLRVVRSLGVPYELRVTCAPGFVDESDASAMACLLSEGDDVVVQRYRSDRVLDPEWAAAAVAPTEAELGRILSILRQAAPKARIRGT